MKVFALAAATVAICCAGSASAQVRYQPYPTPDLDPVAPTPYGYPVPYGYLQPDEVLGTSPSFVIRPYAATGQPVVGVVQRCQYPNGWNVTDFSRDVNGIPNGTDHICLAPPRVRSRY